MTILTCVVQNTMTAIKIFKRRLELLDTHQKPEENDETEDLEGAPAPFISFFELAQGLRRQVLEMKLFG